MYIYIYMCIYTDVYCERLATSSKTQDTLSNLHGGGDKLHEILVVLFARPVAIFSDAQKTHIFWHPNLKVS